MKNTIHPIIPSVAIILLMTTACRSTMQMSSTQSTTSSITTQSMDSTMLSILNRQKTTTTITFLPMQTPAFPAPAAPDVPAPVQDLADALIAQGGGTIIITQEECAQNDTTTVKHTIDDEQTQNKSENHETQSTSQLPRASPWIDKIFYIFLLLAFIIILLQGRNR